MYLVSCLWKCLFENLFSKSFIQFSEVNIEWYQLYYILLIYMTQKCQYRFGYQWHLWFWIYVGVGNNSTVFYIILDIVLWIWYWCICIKFGIKSTYIHMHSRFFKLCINSNISTVDVLFYFISFIIVFIFSLSHNNKGSNTFKYCKIIRIFCRMTMGPENRTLMYNTGNNV